MNDQASGLRRQFQREPNPDAVKRARRLAVTSGKGGVGKSNVSLNLSIALGRLGKRVLLVDADTNLANIDILLGLRAKHTLADAILGNVYFSDILLKGPEGISILPGSSGVIELMESDHLYRKRISDAFDDLEREFDILLIDTGAGLTENVVQFVAGSDEMVLVTNSEPTAITDAYAMIKVAGHRNPNLKMHVVINLAPSQAAAYETFEKLQLAVRGFLKLEINLLGHLPVDPNVPVAVDRQEPFLLSFPRSTATTSMVMMARKLLRMPYRQDADNNFVHQVMERRVDE